MPLPLAELRGREQRPRLPAGVHRPRQARGPLVYRRRRRYHRITSFRLLTMNKIQRQSLHAVLAAVETEHRGGDKRLLEAIAVLQPLLEPRRKKPKAILPG